MGMAMRATIANRRPLVFHEDVFYEYFKPYRHPLSHHDIWAATAWKPMARILIS